ncbi:hypothetical protein EW026_g907 [Hermanssonia centrifuga]|uniref:Uncharacterized protein n=1 Tax=Hermanssonia centrifuga TaxID=98765 RepID=A0A4S4KT68_9APHY|nr:hypothetical protein EW026_g907 [Hermanssonia centrifuga]
MRTKHTAHSLPSFPIYSSAFVSANELILGGGGGQSRSGIKNKLRLYRVESDTVLELVDELELDKGEDAPMSMAGYPETKQLVCGVNSSAEALKTGENQNCRRFIVRDGNTLKFDAVEDDFQKVTVLSPDGGLLAAAGNKDLALLRFPSLDPVAIPIHLDKGEIYDATFSADTLVICTTVSLLVYSLPQQTTDGTTEKKAGKQKEVALPKLDLVKTVDRPTLPGQDGGSSFRSARYHPLDSKVLYTVVNAVPPRNRTKNSPRRAFVCKWNTEKWEVAKLRKVGDRGLTCFDVSANGKFLAFGSSDYTVGILDSQTLAPLLTILKAHEFPPTTLRFNPASNLLMSGSADNTVRIVTIPDHLAGASWSSWIIVIVTLLVILFAIIAQQMHQAF